MPWFPSPQWWNKHKSNSVVLTLDLCVPATVNDKFVTSALDAGSG